MSTRLLPAKLRFRVGELRAAGASGAAPAALPDGIVGRVEGWALVYDEVDTYGTTFAPGCLERTKRERVAAGKVKLYWDHGDAVALGMYDTDLHIGVVRSLTTRPMGDGRTGEWMVADLFDTPKGREAHEYLRAVLAAGSETGLSIGMVKDGTKQAVTLAGRKVLQYTEVPLREISITSNNSVPDTDVVTVRMDGAGATPAAAPADRAASPDARLTCLNGLLKVLDPAVVRCALAAAGFKFVPEYSISERPSDSGTDTAGSNAEAADSPATATVRADAGAQDSAADAPEGGTPQYATMDERLRAVRQSYAQGV